MFTPDLSLFSEKEEVVVQVHDEEEDEEKEDSFLSLRQLEIITNRRVSAFFLSRCSRCRILRLCG